MANYEQKSVTELLVWNTYPGRGILIGMTPDGQNAVAAYFIMGRSANSRNRIFVKKQGAVFTEPFDPAKVEDPSLIIYAALRQFKNHLIVTNGDQFEPDAPNFTPRISGVLNFGGPKRFDYELSILKSVDAEGSACERYHFEYPGTPGLGHLIHTYVCDGKPLPSFEGEPKRVTMENDIDVFAETLWNALDPDNKISLYVLYINVRNGRSQDKLFNKYQ